MLNKNYSPSDSDKKWCKIWKEKKFFQADPTSNKPPFCIVIPPPNVTGSLHMGHALVNTLQDIIIRWKRMSGYEVLWVPGTDHAGIATQTVVERHLIANEGKRRTDYSREAFLKHVWAWKEAKQGHILGQLETLGCSCDWSRLRFTLDDGCSEAVFAMFKKLFDEGLIYRGDYLVNWDPATGTALADDEVEYEEREGKLWHFKYGELVIATTRPETMLGDTAVAVHPSDERYSHLIGKKLTLPLMNREIPIIGDHRVDPEFGTGALKITPAHDPNDYQMGLDNDLPFINIMTPEGHINENGGPYAGLSMADTRKAVVAEMDKQGLLVKTEPHTHRVGISYRSKATIEPYMSKQWFVKMSAFSEKMKKAVSKGKVKLIPGSWENTYNHWIDNLRDWCISRQLWWGHRIPIWHKDGEMQCTKTCPGDGWEQDPDVLDTWFSSALWPFSTLGWPKKTPEFEKFYPNNVLITGHDILFFWVARMIMMGEAATDELPFPETFLHGLIYGKSYWRGNSDYVTAEEQRRYDHGEQTPKEVKSKWEKMSKSKGNVIDPLEIIEEYGTDAMRMALTASATGAREIDLDRRKFDEFKNFANKVWNGARFVFMNLKLTTEELGKGWNSLDLEDEWILSKLSSTIEGVNNHLTHYQFDQAALLAYDFFWKEFCAYYVEAVKPNITEKKQQVLTVVLCAAIRLLHPMAPFITEELFAMLKERFDGLESSHPYIAELAEALKSPAACVSPYPKTPHEPKLEVEKTFEMISEVVYAIRNIRGEMGVPPGTKVDVYLSGEYALAEEHSGLIKALVKIETLHFHEKAPTLSSASTAAVHGMELLVPLPESLIAKEHERLTKELEKLQNQISSIENQLKNEQFVSRAPAELVAQRQGDLKLAKDKRATIQEKLQA